jgi:TatD DNase family protein
MSTSSASSIPWPPLDAHAHVDVTISATDLLELRAVIFAASRTLAESRDAIARQPRDLLTVWGLGVHPGVKTALDTFDPDTFDALLEKTAFVGEIGLDGRAKSRLAKQRHILAIELAMLQQRPRMTSVHSYGATSELIEELERRPIKGLVLHWWKGDRSATQRALELGAYFSVNAAALRGDPIAEMVPLDRLLLETDHPDGNRYSPTPRRPGNIASLEASLGRHFNLTPAQLRVTTWRNLKRLIEDVGCHELLPPRVSSMLLAVPPTDAVDRG